MPSRKPTKKKSSHRKKLLKSLQRGKIFGAPLMIVVAVLVLLIGAAILFKPWQMINTSVATKTVKVVKPSPDLGRARQMTIDPTRDNIMQIETREKVRITLEVPKGAIKQKTLVKLIPFYYDNKSESPTAGVVIGPASVSFEKPVTLSFNFSESKFKNKAPKNLKVLTVRPTGESQVLQINSEATTFTPTLIARSSETENYLPARVLTGGAYVFSLDGVGQVANAKKALDEKGMHSLTIIESATTLLFSGQTLTKEELVKAKGAVAKILSKKTPPAQEMFAAVVLQQKIKGKKFSLIPQAYAYDETEGYFQIACKTDGLSVEEYIGFSKTAQLLGHDAIGQNCLKKAKNLVAEAAKSVIGNPNATKKEVLTALKDVQIIGLDDETNLDSQLTEKFKEVTVKEASKVSQDPNATVVDKAIQLQNLKEAGVESGPTHDALEKAVTDKTSKFDEATDDPNDHEATTDDNDPGAITVDDGDGTIDEEEILYNQGMSAMGVAMLQAFGIEQYDEASMKKIWDDHEGTLKELNEAVYAMCKEMEADNCDAQHQDLVQKIEEGQKESYRLAEQVGEVQSKEYEEPEYLENNGDYELYFEVDLTPTPEEGSDVENSDDQSEEVESEDPAYNEQGVTNYDDSADDQGDQPESQEESEQSSGE